MFHVCKRVLALGLIGIFLVACGDEDNCDAVVDFIDQVDGTDKIEFNLTKLNQKVAQKFKSEADTRIKMVSVSMRKVGDPSGDVRITIREKDGTYPDKDFVSRGGPQSFSASKISSDFFTQVSVEFPIEVELGSNRDHFIVLDFSDGSNGSDYFEVAASSGAGAYSEGEAWVFDGDEEDEDLAWNQQSNKDLMFTIDQCVAVN